MSTAREPATRRVERTADRPGYVYHPDFGLSSAARLFAAHDLVTAPTEYEARYMPDDVTRDHARRMHYAGHRVHTARTAALRESWRAMYFGLRDRIVLGNRKLIYRAVRRRMAVSNRADDLVGDCHIVLIHAVAAFNPWLDVRFSTYAFTCLIRALSRLSQRLAADWLTRALSLDALPDADPPGREAAAPPASAGTVRLDDFLRGDHPLLSDREKTVIVRRFGLTEQPGHPTLETVGRDLGLSKERVRQVQATALEKLRQALAGPGGHG